MTDLILTTEPNAIARFFEGSQSARDLGKIRALCLSARCNLRGSPHLEKFSQWPSIQAWSGADNWLIRQRIVRPSWIWSQACDGGWYLAADHTIAAILNTAGDYVTYNSFGKPHGHGRIGSFGDIDRMKFVVETQVEAAGIFGFCRSVVSFEWTATQPTSIVVSREYQPKAKADQKLEPLFKEKMPEVYDY